MDSNRKTKKIKCAIFHARNESIDKILRALDETTDFKQKIMIAHDYLLDEVEELLSCDCFSKKRIECMVCHNIAKLRKERAYFIIPYLSSNSEAQSKQLKIKKNKLKLCHNKLLTA